jgi:hypothetical protein
LKEGLPDLCMSVKHTETGKNIPYDYKMYLPYGHNMYQIVVKYSIPMTPVIYLNWEF